MKNKLALRLIAFFALTAAVFIGCKKDDTVTTPPTLSTFADKSKGSYYIQDKPNDVFKVAVGVTTVSDKDRTIGFTVSSPTGAAAGEQYTLASNSVVIPAGQAIGYIEVKGIFAGYPTGRIDTLNITLNSGEVPTAGFNTAYTIIMQKYCEVNIASLLGDYTAQDYSGSATLGGSYITTLTELAPGTNGTKDTIVVTNWWDTGNPVQVELDWTDPANFKTTVLQGFYVYDHTTYGAVKTKARGTGTFSSCDQTFVFNYSHYVNAGTFTNLYSTRLTR